MASPQTALPTSTHELSQAARRLWRLRGQAIGTEFDVVACPFSDADLVRLASQSRRVAYLPRELSGRSGRVLLSRLFAGTHSYALLANSPVTDDVDYWGWFDYEEAVDASLVGLTERELLAVLKADGRRLLTLNEYVVASHDLHEATDYFLDEQATWTRLASRIDGNLIAARFDGKATVAGLGGEAPVAGSLLVAWDTTPATAAPVLGARSSGSRHLSTIESASETESDALLSTPEASNEYFAEAWAQATEAFIGFGFHTELGLTADEYLETLPQFPDQPVHYRGRLDRPIVVETRIEWRRQAQLAGVRLSYTTTRSVRSSLALPQPHPYVAWCNDWGQRFDGPVTPENALRSLAVDEVGVSIEELLAFELCYPNYSASGRFYDAIGHPIADALDAVKEASPTATRYPCLCHWRGRPELGVTLTPAAYSVSRPLIRGSQTQS